MQDLYADAAGGVYDPTETTNGIRSAVESWRTLRENEWQGTPTTARLLRHWRTRPFAKQRPFSCQVEAVETVIWLTEVAPRRSAWCRRFWAHLEAANAAANPHLVRLALKLATGAGNTLRRSPPIYRWTPSDMARPPLRVDALTPDEATRRNDHRGAGGVRAARREGADPRRLCATRPRPRSATGAAGQERRRLVRPRRRGAAAVHPGEGAPPRAR